MKPPADDRIDEVASRSYLGMMYTVGLKILKNKLSEYVRLAAAGETIVITDRGRVVAEIVSPRRHQHETFVERGVREGWLTPATDQSSRLPPRKPIPGLTLEQLLADLDRDREDRW
jgi:prevent-host-death family protein